MIARVHKRHTQLYLLVRYLFGPGRREEHVNPHLAAGWAGCGPLSHLEPPSTPEGGRDVRRLVDLLAQPVATRRPPPKDWVWHCSIKNHPTDRILSDAQWEHIAGEVMAAVGLAPHGDLDAVRWVAVRHADDHIHLVATLVRQDGRIASCWQDWTKSRRACRDLEERYGLYRTGPADRTGHRHPTPAEVGKAARQGRPVTARDELRRRIRTALAGSASEDEFFARLADSGVRVAFRYSSREPSERTGYRVALPDDTGKDGQPVWYSGGKLANDLTLPKLRQRWTSAVSSGPAVRVSPATRVQALRDAAATITAAADMLPGLAGADPAGAQAMVQAAADTLAALATAVEGRKPGMLSRAAVLFDKATRQPFGRVAPPTSRSDQLRAMSRLVHLMGRISGDEATAAMLALVLDLARLGEAIAEWRTAQDREHQAQAARQAAMILRDAAESGGRLAAAGQTTEPDLTQAPIPHSEGHQPMSTSEKRRPVHGR